MGCSRHRRRCFGRPHRWHDRAAVSLLILASLVFALAWSQRPACASERTTVRVGVGDTLVAVAARLDPTGNAEEHAWELAQALATTRLTAGEELVVVEGPVWSARLVSGRRR